MAGVRIRGEEIRQFILENVGAHPSDIGAVTADKFSISRQAVNNHLKRLIKQGSLQAKGNTRNRTYSLHPTTKWGNTYPLSPNLEEDVIWRDDIAGRLGGLPDNVMDIWHYGTTEMINNAIDHSEGKTVSVSVEKTAVHSEIIIYDDGEGIFRRIQRLLDLNDERHAVLELAKGKLTTDPEKHTGEGIFFSSRMFDKFAILSGDVYFTHAHDKPAEWIMESLNPAASTTVFMKLSNHSSRTLKSVFDEYASGDDYGFHKTVVPVSLGRYGNEMLVSRSQAKRLAARIDRFKIVILDFAGIDGIGQAFADEIFRVFHRQHPEMQIYWINANPDVEALIVRSLSAAATP